MARAPLTEEGGHVVVPEAGAGGHEHGAVARSDRSWSCHAGVHPGASVPAYWTDLDPVMPGKDPQNRIIPENIVLTDLIATSREVPKANAECS